MKRKTKKRNPYRSGSELKCATNLKQKRIQFEYEQDYFEYVVVKKYNPDFYLTKYGFYIEVKGRFVSTDRAKHLRVKAAHPDLDIRFMFDNPNAKLYKGSKTTYAEWADKHGYLWCKTADGIPKEWTKK